jgi:hypothetical protein
VKSSLRLVARNYKERKLLRVTKRAKKMWKIPKGTIIRKSTDPIKTGRGGTIFFVQAKPKSQAGFLLSKGDEISQQFVDSLWQDSG